MLSTSRIEKGFDVAGASDAPDAVTVYVPGMFIDAEAPKVATLLTAVAVTVDEPPENRPPFKVSARVVNAVGTILP